MAGESPDSSEQRESSGEATPGERDPRLAVLREAPAEEPEGAEEESAGEAGEPLSDKETPAEEAQQAREADEAEAAGKAEESERPASDGDGGTVESEDAESEDAESEDGGSEEAEEEAPAEGESEEHGTGGATSDAGESGQDDGDAGPRAAVAARGAGEDASGDDAPADEPEASQRPDEDEPSDGKGKPVEQKPSEKKAESAEAPDEEAGSGKAGSGKAVDQATAVFKAVKASGASAEEASGKEAEPDGKAEPAAKAVDQPTAVFKAVKPSGASAGEALGKEAESERAGSGKTVDQATAVFKAVKPSGVSSDEPAGEKAESAQAESEKKAESAKAQSGAAAKAGDQATTALKAVRPPAAAPGEKDAERTSQFVPLKSLDDAPRKAPLPPETEPAQPEAEALPAETERTKQQPLPPVPPPGEPAPLDLLAQLTNTPPPPETPLRTIVRRIKIWTPLVALLALIFAVVQAIRPLPDPTLDLTARASYAFDGSKPIVPWPAEGQAVLEVDGLGSLGSYGEQKPVPIASVAKVMTAYIILRDHPVKKGTNGAMIDVDRQAADDAKLGADGESVVEVAEGEKITEKEAIQAIMIASANNIARLLARWDAGSEAAFVKKMNATAKGLGMKNTTYTDPSGLREQTVSTAADQVKLGKKAMDDPLFREVVRMPDYVDRKGEKHRNWNGLVPLDGVVGIKTGTTSKAGGNLLFAAEQQVGGTTQLIVGAVLGQHQPPIIDTVLAQSKKLIDTAQDVLVSRTVVKKGDVVGVVDDGLGGRTPVIATRDVSAVGWSGLTVELGLTDGGKTIPHEAKAGTKVGTLTVGSGPGQVKVPVALQKDLAEPTFGSKVTRIG